jgi:hypothetical protein
MTTLTFFCFLGLSPKHRFPAQLIQVVDGLKYILKDHDPSNVLWSITIELGAKLTTKLDPHIWRLIGGKSRRIFSIPHYTPLPFCSRAYPSPKWEL